MQKIRGSRAAAADARRKERARRGEAQCKGRSRQHLDWGILWAVCVGSWKKHRQYKSSGAPPYWGGGVGFGRGLGAWVVFQIWKCLGL